MPALVTSFRRWSDLQARDWGRLARGGDGRFTFVPRDDPPVAVAGVVGGVHPVLAPLVEHLLAWLVTHRGRPLDKAGSWGASIRPIRGREAAAYAGDIDAWSNHSGRGAIDIEAPRNPLGAYGRGDFPPGWEDECHRWGFAWGASTRDGGDYIDRPDRMHIEFIGTYAQALAYREQLLAEQGRGPAAPASPTVAAPTPQEDDMYVKCQPDKGRKDVWTAILSGPIFVGLGPTEVPAADAAIAKGATMQWVELGTWHELDRRSKLVCGLNPDGTVKGS